MQRMIVALKQFDMKFAFSKDKYLALYYVIKTISLLCDKSSILYSVDLKKLSDIWSSNFTFCF